MKVAARGAVPLLGLWLALVPGALPGEAGEYEQGVGLLGRMSQALRSRDYEGTLVHLVDNRLETLHVIRRIREGRVQERLVSLSGPVRAVSREHDRVTCSLADGHPISLASGPGQGLLHPLAIDPGALGRRYSLSVEGAARVAGRDAEVLLIAPRDELRYGLRLHLDRESGLPLKRDLIDSQGRGIEQLMFTEIAVGASVAGEGAAPLADSAGSEAPAPATLWRFERCPAGFEEVMHDVLKDPGGVEVEHFVFSDRLASYSVYVESDRGSGLLGIARSGAVHAAGRRFDGYQLTAVGEVPAATLEAALAGARRAQVQSSEGADR